MGIHSGRENVGGVAAPTNGCIRTTDPAMATITATAATDPLETITVTNNQSQNMCMEGDCGPVKSPSLETGGPATPAKAARTLVDGVDTSAVK